ncbi:MAG: tetratricopeptide repeat protein, partial [Calditrichota bacterium]
QATANMWLGQLYEAEGQWEQAVKFSEQGLALSPANANYLYLTGAQLVKIERYEHAIQYLKEVIRQRPWHAGAHYNLGQAYVRMGETRIGEQYLTEADSLRQIDRQIEDLVIFTEMHPEEIQNWINLGDTLRYYERFEEALRAYESASLLEPYNLPVQTNIATLLFQLGNTELAIEHYMAVLQQDPTYTHVWFNLGVAFARTGQMDDARWAWENLLKYDPQHQLARQYLSMLK